MNRGHIDQSSTRRFPLIDRRQFLGLPILLATPGIIVGPRKKIRRTPRRYGFDGLRDDSAIWMPTSTHGEAWHLVTNHEHDRQPWPLYEIWTKKEGGAAQRPWLLWGHAQSRIGQLEQISVGRKIQKGPYILTATSEGWDWAFVG